jgi:hypothetical protein
MAHLIILQEATFRNYQEAFRGKLNVSQWKYFVTVLMGMIHCQASRTLSGMLREVAVWVTVGGLSRFLISPAWSVEKLTKARYAWFSAEIAPVVAAAHAQQQAQQPKQKGRPVSTQRMSSAMQEK